MSSLSRSIISMGKKSELKRDNNHVLGVRVKIMDCDHA